MTAQGMEIGNFKERDIEEIISLFYETVHTVNSKDYSQEQLVAWAPRDERKIKVKTWKESFNKNISYVAKIHNKVVGFGDLTHSGHLDRLYVHKNYQGKRIASALVAKLEYEAKKTKTFKNRYGRKYYS